MAVGDHLAPVTVKCGNDEVVAAGLGLQTVTPG